jgi:hypothetical protein
VRATKRWFVNLRLFLALVIAAAVVGPLFFRGGGPWLALLGLIPLFLWLGDRQERAWRQENECLSRARFIDEGLARHDGRWRDVCPSGAEFMPEEGSGSLGYAHDLDLFGPSSLYQFITRAVTTSGSEKLATWLAAPADHTVVRVRQGAVSVLRDRMMFRESLFALASMVRTREGAFGPLTAWSEARGELPKWARILAVVQPVVFLLTTLGFALGLPIGLWILVLLLHIAGLIVTRPCGREEVDLLSDIDVGRVAELVDLVEREPLESEGLLRTQQMLRGADGVSAKRALRSLQRIGQLLEARLNLLFSLTLGPVLFWDVHCAWAAIRWRARWGAGVRGWFEAIGEMEALASLAAFSQDRPAFAFPNLVDAPGVYRVEALGHPLLNESVAVSNDLLLNGPGSIVLLSGSNMSGKSTLLRAVGLSVVLARAGGPVPARSLTLSSLVLGVSMRVSDSLSEGTSFFYAEVQRLKAIVDLAQGQGPECLFLLDEILQGTNSRERLLGAVGVLRLLSQLSSFGLVTTHDLQLAQVAEGLPEGQVVHRHFSDVLEGEKLHFDYRLRSGPLQSTNALALMRSVGLDVDLA